MELNKAVANPMLIGAMELMKAEPNAEHNNMLLGEIMKARFLTPALIDPEPIVDGEGDYKLADGAKIHYSLLKAPDGKIFFAAFTDRMELEKWKSDENIHHVVLSYDEFAAMLFTPDASGNECPVAGVIVNPFGANLVMKREMIQALAEARAQSNK